EPEDELTTACLSPRYERSFIDLGIEICGIALHEGHNPRVLSRFLVLHENLEHDHPWPPVRVVPRAEIPVAFLAIEGPVDPGFGFRDEGFITEQICQRQKAVEVVGAPFPVLSSSATPCGIIADGIPVIAQASREVIGLAPQDISKPTAWIDAAQRQLTGWKILQRS